MRRPKAIAGAIRPARFVLPELRSGTTPVVEVLSADSSPRYAYSNAPLPEGVSFKTASCPLPFLFYNFYDSNKIAILLIRSLTNPALK